MPGYNGHNDTHNLARLRQCRRNRQEHSSLRNIEKYNILSIHPAPFKHGVDIFQRIPLITLLRNYSKSS